MVWYGQTIPSGTPHRLYCTVTERLSIYTYRSTPRNNSGSDHDLAYYSQVTKETLLAEN